MTIGSTAYSGVNNYTIAGFSECAFNLTNVGPTAATVVLPNITNLWAGKANDTAYQQENNATSPLIVTNGTTAYMFFWNNNTAATTFSLSWSEPAPVNTTTTGGVITACLSAVSIMLLSLGATLF